jgi:hypothetical protein
MRAHEEVEIECMWPFFFVQARIPSSGLSLSVDALSFPIDAHV